MKLLAVDTSTSSCSVALFDGGRLLAETICAAGKTHSRHLMSMIHHILERCECNPSDINGIGVTRGPGTFTGLRIGISTVKGLCTATQASVIGVSSLAALAFPFCQVERPVVAMIDARRNEVYWAQYQGGDNGLETISPVSLTAPEVAAKALPKGALLVGSGALLYRSVFETHCPGGRFADATQHIIRGASVGMLALKRFRRQDLDLIDTLTPEYIRKSDAQIQMAGTC
jgi:tRNA threonylcarbamoyladenosine biosynthesis protein TsaB